MWGNGSYKQRNLEPGTPVVKKANPIALFCFVTGIQGQARLLSGNKDGPKATEEKSKH